MVCAFAMSEKEEIYRQKSSTGCVELRHLMGRGPAYVDMS
jgi:hypothetical protein